MPYVSNMNDEENKTDPNASQPGGVAPTGGGGGAVRLSPQSSVPTVGGGGTAGSAPSGAAGGTTPTPSAGGQFGSLNQYLTANQGQAQPLANQVSTGVGKEYNNLNTQNNAAIANINNQVTNAPGYTPNNPSIMASEAANPVSFSNDPNNVKQFQSLLKNTYSGPTSAEGTSDYANQQTNINNAIAAGTAATTTEAGRENLLSQNEAAPTTGVTALNSAILSQDPNALASVENAYKPFNNLLTNLNTGAQGVDTTIGKEQSDAAASAKAANDAIASQIGALNTDVTSELTAAQQKAAAQNMQLKSDVAAGTPSAQDLRLMGITGDQWNALSAAQKAAATAQTVQSNQGQFGATSGTSNIDLTNFLTQQDPNAVLNAANVATPQDYARAQAFQTLLNGMNLNTPSAIINPATVKEAGTASTNLNNYDYQTALNTATSAKADETAAAQAYVDALQSGADEQHAQAAAANAVKNSKTATATGVASTPLAATMGVGAGVPAAAKNYASNIITTNPKQLAMNVGSMGLIPTGQAVAAGVKQAANTVVNVVKHGTWVCTAMREAGIMTQNEIDRLHDHLYKALWKKPWSFFKYAILGKPLVILANLVGIDWEIWKWRFYTAPMSIADPTKAVELYERSFWILANEIFYRFTHQEIMSHD